MGRQLSLVTRRELVEILKGRYANADREGKQAILDEFVAVSDYHRKHAIRVLGEKPGTNRPQRIGKRIYDEAVLSALIVLWEAADRICGKRLKVLLPVLIDAMERHGHLQLAVEVRSRLLRISAATIDRMLSSVREKGRRRRSGVSTALRKAIPVRTFGDWKDPAPGSMEADFVCHCGTTMAGTFVSTFVLTDIATGWTECIAMPAREQHLVTEALRQVRKRLPFPLLELDTDNDPAFINGTVLDYCHDEGIHFTRSRPYRKNDQAWVEQKNGAIVRRFIGYGRLEGLAMTETLSRLYEYSRLYVNFLQPSFKLKSKTREGAQVKKKYHVPATPYERLLASIHISAKAKESLRRQFNGLDPIHLLAEIRRLQAVLAAGNDKAVSEADPPARTDFLRHLSVAWREGEVRPTHRKKTAPRTWRTWPDAFEGVWPTLLSWLDEQPDVTAKDLLVRLQHEVPDSFADGQLRTLQRRVKQWRIAMANRLIMQCEDETFEPEGAVAAAGA